MTVDSQTFNMLISKFNLDLVSCTFSNILNLSFDICKPCPGRRLGYLSSCFDKINRVSFNPAITFARLLW